jgi:predicted phage terminase large subunit-like protein
MGVEEQVSQAKAIDARWPGEHMLFVEAVAYQLALVELMEKAMLPVQTIKPTTDKRARLMVASTYIKNGTVEFPRTGCEDLIIQLLGFGVEEHDDLVDALVMMINGIIEAGIEMPKIVLLG